MTTETWLETANKADATAKVIELCKGKYAEVIICEQEKVDANSKTMKYDDLLESTNKVWMLKHMTKLNDNRNDNEMILVNANFKRKSYSFGKTRHNKNHCS